MVYLHIVLVMSITSLKAKNEAPRHIVRYNVCVAPFLARQVLVEIQATPS